MNWIVKEQGDADEYCILRDDNRWVIAFSTNGELHIAECRKIAHLVSAAPDMLKALEYLIDLNEDGHLMSLEEKQLVALKAIRKARGE